MHFNVRTLSFDCIPDLINGTVDFAVVYEGFDDKRLNYECFARTNIIYLLCRKDHPLTKVDSFTVKDLSEFPLVEIDNYQDLSCPLLVDICQEMNCSMHQGVTYTESVAGAFQLLAKSDRVAVMCNQFTRQFADQMEEISYVVLPSAILNRIREMRSQNKPIGNYIFYGNANQSLAFKWVKNELLIGLRKAWNQALDSESLLKENQTQIAV